jgi:putative ATP-dependent endonuclease of OLD family
VGVNVSILVQEVRVRNFRSLRNINVKLEPLTLLVGANNSGKTSFLRALELALGVGRKYVSKEDIYISPNESIINTKGAIIDILIVPMDKQFNRNINFNDDWNEHFGSLLQFDTVERQFLAVRTKIEFDVIKNEYVISQEALDFWYEDPEQLYESKPVRGVQLTRRTLEKLPLFFMDAQRDMIKDLKESSSYWSKLASDVDLDKGDISRIERILNKLNEIILEKSDVLNHIKTNLTQLNEIVTGTEQGVQISPLTRKLRDLNRGIDILYQDNGSESFPLNYHGMGTRSWAALLTFRSYCSWMLKKNEENSIPFSPLLALEEPEAHLHPHAQRHIFQQINEFEGQKIVSTHSPYIVSQGNISSIRYFCKKNSECQATQINLTNLDDEDLRKINREVMHTRGELFFSRGIVLFEGETEEQALPIFFQKYFNKHPYELGFSFIGVGGKGAKYLPFLRIAEGLNIDWYVFSDGETDVINELDAIIRSLGKSIHDNNIIKIDQGLNFEKIMTRDYKDELQSVIIQSKINAAVNDRHKIALEREWNGREFSNEEILEELKNGKTKYGPLIAKKLIEINDPDRQIPSKIKDLFIQIANRIGIERMED